MRRLLILNLILLAPVIAIAQTSSHFVFYRPKTTIVATHAMDSAPVWIDGKKFAVIDADRFVVADLEPGRHVFYAGDKKWPTVIEAVAGKTYYLRQEYRYGKVFPKTVFTAADELSAAEYVKRCKPEGE